MTSQRMANEYEKRENELRREMRYVLEDYLQNYKRMREKVITSVNKKETLVFVFVFTAWHSLETGYHGGWRHHVLKSKVLTLSFSEMHLFPCCEERSNNFLFLGSSMCHRGHSSRLGHYTFFLFLFSSLQLPLIMTLFTVSSLLIEFICAETAKGYPLVSPCDVKTTSTSLLTSKKEFSCH